MMRKIAQIFYFLLIFSCSVKPTSTLQSDWRDLAALNDQRNYAVDWACEPKLNGASSEGAYYLQDEYCEWKSVVKNEAKTCTFTTSFDSSRALHLRGQNTMVAARYLVQHCTEAALKSLEAGRSSPGSLCNDVVSGCVEGRNSDPEICDKVRWAVKERYTKNIDFCINDLTQDDKLSPSGQPLMQFGLLTDLPEECKFTTDDHTEVECTIAKDDSCFSIAGQLRPGINVVTTAFDKSDALPDSKQCFRP